MRLESLLCLISAALLASHAEVETPRVNKSPSGLNAGFTLLSPAETGILFTNTLSAQHASENQILLNGSGVAAGDVDGDGKCDVYFCSLEGENRLYRNLGNWRFADVTA